MTQFTGNLCSPIHSSAIPVIGRSFAPTLVGTKSAVRTSAERTVTALLIRESGVTAVTGHPTLRHPPT
eukprot:4499368-Prymnesium_polylepis.1